MVSFMFRANSKDIRRKSTLLVSYVCFEQVIICWDVIKSLLNDCWSILKLLRIKCCPRLSDFYWHNALMYNPFLNKNAGEINTRNTTK